MADLIATRYGIVGRTLAHAALQTIVLAAADAIDALDDAHQRVRRIGVPDKHAGRLTPRQRWEQLLRNLFPASIVLVDPHGTASPELVDLPAGSEDDERAVRRLLNAAAAFLLAETIQIEDVVELSQHWAGPRSAGPDENLDAADKDLARVTRASHTLLDHAESGRWRDLLAAYLPHRATPAPTPQAPPAQEPLSDSGDSSGPALTVANRRRQQQYFVVPDDAADRFSLVLSPGGRAWDPGEESRLVSVLRLASAGIEPRLALWSEQFPLPRAAVGDRGVTALVSVSELAACARRYALHRDRLAGSLSDVWSQQHNLISACVDRIELRRSPTRGVAGGSSGVLALPCWHSSGGEFASWAIRWSPATDASTLTNLLLPGSSWSDVEHILELARPLLVAAGQMGATVIETQLAGLSLLEAFAQANPSQRQTVVNILCSYLRTSPPNDGRNLDTAHVRLAVQAALAGHLRPGAHPAHPYGGYWPDLHIDLTNAVLTDLDLAGCHVHTARFTGAQFRGDTSFVNVRFAAAAFDNAKFEGDAVFEQVVFAGDTAFRQATFHGAAVFEDVRFGGDARFEATRFGGRAVFAGSEFTEDARFSGTEFAGDAVFHRVTFAGLARFGQARFFDGIRFRETRFDGEQGSSRAVDAGTALLEREPCWVRTDVPATVAPRRMWPAGWTVQPTPDHPHGGHGASWGKLVPARQPLPA